MPVIVATPGTGALFTIYVGLSRGARASLVADGGCTLGFVPMLVDSAVFMAMTFVVFAESDGLPGRVKDCE